MTSEPELTAQRMLLELDFVAGEVERQQIRNCFGDALDPIRRMLVEQQIRRDANGYQKFGIVHLLARNVSDLLAGGHLASHCYLPQAYCVLRPVIDSCDLIELFANSAEQAETWALTEKAHIDFAPARVRELLGRERHSPVHGHFSESGSHPRFRGAQLSGGMRVAIDDPNDRTAVLRIGPMWPEDPSTLTIWLLAFQLVAETAICGQHIGPLTGDEHQAERIWLRALLDCLTASNTGVGLVLDQLGEPTDAPIRRAYTQQLAETKSRLSELKQ